jgi:hypothetical protein
MTSINVSQRTQMIVVDVASRSVSVINAGPVGPAGPTGEVSLAQMNTALDLKVAKAGDTMTGALTIPVTPTAVGHATSKQYVDTAISNAVTALLDGTPGALDTLNELAAALGDDANFAASVTTALSNKQPLDSDLTALAGLATTAWGRQVLTLADSAAALTYLGAGTAATKDVPASGNASSSQVVKGDDTRLQAAADLTSHVALKNAHGVTRELITFTAATPVHIPGNLLSHDTQRGMSGVFTWSTASVASSAGGADDGGSAVVTATAVGTLTALTNWNVAPASVGQGYTCSVRVSITASAPKTLRASLLYYNAAGGHLLTVEGPLVTCVVNATVTLFATSTSAPANTAFVRLYVSSVETFAIGESLRVSVLCIGTSPTVPGSCGVVRADGGLMNLNGPLCFRSDGAGGVIITGSGGSGNINIAIPIGSSSLLVRVLTRFRNSAATSGISVWAAGASFLGVDWATAPLPPDYLTSTYLQSVEVAGPAVANYSGLSGTWGNGVTCLVLPFVITKEEL